MQNRGWIGQESLGRRGVCLSDLNARLYDSLTASFLQPDPVVGQPFSTHGWNAYAYAGNNPMTFSDPTGMCFAGCFWKQQLFRDLVGIAVAFALDNPEWGFLIGDGLSAGVNAGIAGAASGAISTGTLKGTLLAAAQADSSSGIGDIKDLLTLQNGSLGSVLMHATAGGLFSVAGGGKFKSGFLAAGFADLAGPVVDKISQSNMYVGLAAATVTGGLGSVLGGGKFENGAVTGAFGYLFNFIDHHNCTQQGVCGQTSEDDGRSLTEGEIAIAQAEFPNDINTNDVRVMYDRSGDIAYTPGNTMHFPSSMAYCQDFSTCNNQADVGWFTHEVTHVWQSQHDISPVFGHLISGDIFNTGEYLSKSEYTNTRNTNRLDTEEQADWHKWHYLCTHGLQQGC